MKLIIFLSVLVFMLLSACSAQQALDGSGKLPQVSTGPGCVRDADCVIEATPGICDGTIGPPTPEVPYFRQGGIGTCRHNWGALNANLTTLCLVSPHFVQCRCMSQCFCDFRQGVCVGGDRNITEVVSGRISAAMAGPRPSKGGFFGRLTSVFCGDGPIPSGRDGFINRLKKIACGTAY